MMDEYKSGWAARAASEPDDEIIRSGQLFKFLMLGRNIKYLRVLSVQVFQSF